MNGTDTPVVVRVEITFADGSVVAVERSEVAPSNAELVNMIDRATEAIKIAKEPPGTLPF